MQAPLSAALPSGEYHNDRDTKPRTLIPEIQVLPSPPLTREASLASAGSDGRVKHDVSPQPQPVEPEAKAIPRPLRVPDEGAPTTDEIGIAERHFLRTSAPFLDMASSQGSTRSVSPGREEDDMIESPAEEEVIDISGAGASDLEAGYGAGPSSTAAGPSRQAAEDHPLATRSPKRRSLPPWETLEPPPDNNMGTFTSADTRGYHTLRSKPSCVI